MYKMFHKNKLLKVLSLNAIAIGVSFVLGIASTKIISLLVGTAGMAVMGSFRNFSTMLKSTTTLGINNTLIKLIGENKEDKTKLSALYATSIWFFLSLATVLCVLVVSFSTYISQFIFLTDRYSFVVSLFGFALPLVVLNAFWMAVYNGWEKFKKIVTIQIISNVLIFAVSTLLIVKEKLFGALVAIAVAEGIAFLVTLFFIIKNKDFSGFKFKWFIEKKYVKIILSFSGMALLSAILVPLTLIAIRNFIIQYLSIEQAGIWDALNRLSGFYMLFFLSGLTMYYAPKLASLQTDKAFFEEVKSYFKLVVPLFVLVVVCIYIFRSFFIEICFTKEFLPIKDILIWQILGDFFKILSLAFGYQILIKMMVKKYFLVELFFNLSYLFLSVFLMQLYGISGVTKAYFLSNFLSFVVIIILFKKVLFLNTKNNSN